MCHYCLNLQINLVKNAQTHKSPNFCKDNSSETSDSGSLFDSPTTSRCSTLTLSDADTLSPSKCNATKSGPIHGNRVQNFEVPWHKLPKALLDGCAKIARPKPSDRREMVRIICDEIREYAILPGRKNISKIAEMVVTKYKESFCDTVGDTIVGSGYESLRKQMEERLGYLNRKENKPGFLRNKLNSAGDDGSEPPAKITKPVCGSYGCINW